MIQFGVAKSLQRTIERMVDERYRTDRIHRLFNPRRGQVNLVSGGKEPFREHSASRAFEPSTIPYVDEFPFRNCRASPPSSSVITLPAIIGRLHCTLADQVPQSANRGIHDSIVVDSKRRFLPLTTFITPTLTRFPRRERLFSPNDREVPASTNNGEKRESLTENRRYVARNSI